METEVSNCHIGNGLICENRDMQPSTLPGKILFMEKLQQKVTFFT